MGTAWILIIFFKFGYAGGTSTAQFSDQQSCQAAAMWVNKKVDSWATSAYANCFPTKDTK